MNKNSVRFGERERHRRTIRCVQGQKALVRIFLAAKQARPRERREGEDLFTLARQRRMPEETITFNKNQDKVGDLFVI